MKSRGDIAACEDRVPLAGWELAALMHALAPSRRVAFAVSGGPDSIGLLTLAHGWAGDTGREIIALIVNHGLRAESYAEAQATKSFVTKELGVRAVLLGGVSPPFGGGNLQAYARARRFSLLCARCRAEAFPDLVLAHHLDDQAETFLLRLARGSGLDGLCAMEGVRIGPEGIRILRPCLTIPASRLRAGVRWFVDDPSNRDIRFARVRLRNAGLSLRRAGLTRARLAGTAALLRNDRGWIEAQSRALMRDIFAFDPLGGFAWLDLAALPEPLSWRILGLALMRVGNRTKPARARSLARVLRWLAEESRPGSSCTLAGTRLITDSRMIAPTHRPTHRPTHHMLICREAALPAAPAIAWRGARRIDWDGGLRWFPSLSARIEGWRLDHLGTSGWRLLDDGARRQARARLPGPARIMLPSIFDAEGPVVIPFLNWRRCVHADPGTILDNGARREGTHGITSMISWP